MLELQIKLVPINILHGMNKYNIYLASEGPKEWDQGLFGFATENFEIL